MRSAFVRLGCVEINGVSMSKDVAKKENRSVLLVDDEPYIIEMLQKEMTKLGLRFFIASDGKTALSLVEKERPAVIISDYKMPGLNGMELLEFLRNLNIQSPVIWITGNADDVVISQAWKKGIFHLFDKPFDPEQVAKEVLNALDFSDEERLHRRPSFLTESFLEKHVQKLSVEIEKELYEKLREQCLKNSVSINKLITDLVKGSMGN